MSRTFRRIKRQCKCARCIESRLRYNQVGKDLFDTGLEQAYAEHYDFLFHFPEFIDVDTSVVRHWSQPDPNYYSKKMNWDEYARTVTERSCSMITKKALQKMICKLMLR